MKDLERKKELILARERAFASAIGVAVFERPTVSIWMILIPILFLHFMYRMQKFKAGLLKFIEDFMTTRRRALDLAIESLETGTKPDIDRVSRQLGLADALERPYAAWLKALFEHYTDLLSASGDSFESLLRAAYRSRTDCLLAFNRLNTVEREFHAVLKPRMSETEGLAGIIGTIEKESQRLRRELTERVFA
jgi:hypothetical protein